MDGENGDVDQLFGIASGESCGTREEIGGIEITRSCGIVWRVELDENGDPLEDRYYSMKLAEMRTNERFIGLRNKMQYIQDSQSYWIDAIIVKDNGDQPQYVRLSPDTKVPGIKQ